MKELAGQAELIVFAVLVVALCYGAVASAFEAATVTWEAGEGKRVASGCLARSAPWFVRAYYAIEPRRHP
jgi:hypothetical protein